MRTESPAPPPKAWGLFAVLLGCDTLAQVFFKIGAAALGPFPTDSAALMAAYALSLLGDPFILAGVGALLGAFFLWLAIISTIDLSEAHPITCLVYGTVAIASALFLGETFTAWQATGVALIVLGAFVTGEP